MTATLTTTAELRQCRCGRWSHTLSGNGLCRDCRLGWVHCVEHGRLEHALSDHTRVTIAEIIQAIPIAGGGR